MTIEHEHNHAKAEAQPVLEVVKNLAKDVAGILCRDEVELKKDEFMEALDAECSQRGKAVKIDGYLIRTCRLDFTKLPPPVKVSTVVEEEVKSIQEAEGGDPESISERFAGHND
jgi:hypothetical protein